MPSDFIANLTDLDDIFAPYTSGTKADATFLFVGGQDLKDRYQKYVSGTKADITYFTEGGVDLKDIFMRLGGDALEVTIVPSPQAYGYNPADGPGVMTIGAEAFPTGGTAPYTYLWTRISGSTSIIIDDATLKAPGWEYTSSSLASVRSAIWRCTVTDDVAATAFAEITVKLQVGGEEEIV